MADSIAPMFKVLKKLTYPQMKLVNDVPVYFLFKGTMFQGKKIVVTDPKEKQKEPPILARGVDMTTGEECEMICNAVLESVLKEEYPDDTYVGKGFEIIKHKKVEGKAYNRFSVSEIELPAAKSPQGKATNKK